MLFHIIVLTFSRFS